MTQSTKSAILARFHEKTDERKIGKVRWNEKGRTEWDIHNHLDSYRDITDDRSLRRTTPRQLFNYQQLACSTHVFHPLASLYVEAAAKHYLKIHNFM